MKEEFTPRPKRAGPSDVTTPADRDLPTPAEVESDGDQASLPTQTFENSAPAAFGGLPAQPGDRMGRYVVRRLLGEGAFGAVFLAEDEELQRKVAIKMLRPERFENEQAVQRFLEEARTVAQLKHPGIVAVYDVGRLADGVPFLVLEYVDGCSLSEAIRRGPLRPEQAMRITMEIAEALAYAHQAGFVHRDLKPDNVLLDATGRPRVADFGVAIHERAQRARAGERAGTLHYMAPEQVRGETHRLDGRADIWSLGITLYQMLTGRLPFGGDSRQQLTDEILNRHPKPPRQINMAIPSPLEQVCLKCCAKEVTDRYCTALDVARDVRRLLGEQSVGSEPPERSERSGWGKSKERYRWQFQAGRVGCALTVAMACLLLVSAPLALRSLQPWPMSADRANTPNATDGNGGRTEAGTASAGEGPPVGESLPEDGSPGLGGWAEGDDTQVVPAAAAPTELNVEVLVWDPQDPFRRGLELRQAGALPLQTDDQVRIHVEADRPAYLYMLWIDSEGQAAPLYPWRGGRWDHRPLREEPVERVQLPWAADEGFPLMGPAGMETLLVLARRTPLPESIRLDEMLNDLPPQTRQSAETCAWFADGKLAADKSGNVRALNFDSRRIDDPVLQTQRTIHERLAPHFHQLRAVSFANAGERR